MHACLISRGQIIRISNLNLCTWLFLLGFFVFLFISTRFLHVPLYLLYITSTVFPTPDIIILCFFFLFFMPVR